MGFFLFFTEPSYFSLFPAFVLSYANHTYKHTFLEHIHILCYIYIRERNQTADNSPSHKELCVCLHALTDWFLSLRCEGK